MTQRTNAEEVATVLRFYSTLYVALHALTLGDLLPQNENGRVTAIENPVCDDELTRPRFVLTVRGFPTFNFDICSSQPH